MKHKTIMIAGTSSGCGKTTLTCAVLQLLKNKNIKTASFKCGPDYIDPMFHSEIIGVKSSNLDMYFCDDNTIRYLFDKNASDLSIIEGVMGFYDGRALNTTEASSYELAKLLDVPVVLTVDCKGMANSALAVIKGFLELYPDNTIAGVVLNNISAMTYGAVKTAIEERFDIKVFGYMPKLPEEVIFGSRHLGLITAAEIADIKEKLNKLAELTSKTIDIEAIINTADSGDEPFIPPVIPHYEQVRIAVAYDKAFCFYYRDNLELLQEMGAELVYFSPLEDERLPDNIHGLYLGGGYPELYLQALSDNNTMLESVRNMTVPCIAECGGFMYLCKDIEGYPMVGYLGGSCHNTGKLTRFGYVELTPKNGGEVVRGHEFHYYDSTDNGDTYVAVKANGKTWDCVHSDNTIFAGFPHTHFYSNIKFAENFYKKCVERVKHDE